LRLAVSDPVPRGITHRRRPDGVTDKSSGIMSRISPSSLGAIDIIGNGAQISDIEFMMRTIAQQYRRDPDRTSHLDP